VNSRIAELQATIQLATEEIQTIQAGCKHEHYYLGIYSYRIGAYDPARICEECLSFVPGITEDEVKQVAADNPNFFLR
jgi:hypothetical protein